MKEEDLSINDLTFYQFGNKVCRGRIVGMKIVTEIIGATNDNGRVGVYADRSYTLLDTDTGMVRADYVLANFEAATEKAKAKEMSL